MRIILKLTCLLIAATFSICSQANIRVNTLQLNFFPGKDNFQDVLITNQGDKTAYVKITPYKRPDLSNPTKLEALKGNPREFGLLVTPNKMAIKPHQIRRVRVISLVKGNKTDVAYVVGIMPVESPLKAIETNSDNSRGGIRVTTGFEVGVYIRPSNAKPVLKFSRDGKTFKIENTGNTNELVADFKQCPAQTSEEDKCITYKNVKRLFAGSSMTIQLEKAEPVEFRSYYLEGVKEHKSN